MKKTILGTITSAALLVSASAYAYDNINPADAYAATTTDANTYILDVRTDSEWIWVGHPGEDKLGNGAGLTGKVVNVSWMITKKKEWMLNPSFLSDISEIFGDNDDVTLITMCRSGSRSAAAADYLEANGYNVKNMVEGFEGGKDMYGYRTLSGWKNRFSGDGYPLPHKTSSPKDPDGYQD
jgi:rhodanese-related sulfurtransferase